MEGWQKIEFPFSDAGVEYRVFGDPDEPSTNHYRCVKAVYLKRETPTGAGSFRAELGDKLLLLDVEQGGILIPHVYSFDICDGRHGFLMGRLGRRTNDHVESNDRRFSRGYALVADHGAPERMVSEPFMLFGVEAVPKAEFDALEEEAYEKYQRAMRIASSDGLSNAWGHAGPAQHTLKG